MVPVSSPGDPRSPRSVPACRTRIAPHPSSRTPPAPDGTRPPTPAPPPSRSRARPPAPPAPRTHEPPVQEDRARSALALLARVLRPRQPHVLAECIEQAFALPDLGLELL